MIVCDRCRMLDKGSSECFVVIEKKETKSGKPRTRRIVKVPIVLCEECLTIVCKHIGRLKRVVELTVDTK